MLSAGVGAAVVTTWCMMHGQDPAMAAGITVVSTISAMVRAAGCRCCWCCVHVCVCVCVFYCDLSCRAPVVRAAACSPQTAPPGFGTPKHQLNRRC
jgi:hypothetical protein